MRKQYYPESIADWEFNLLQSGGSLPRYSGVAYQRGQGIGSFFKGLFRAIWPTVKKVGFAAGKEALRAGSEATRDYINEGKGFKKSLKRRGRQALGRTVSSLGQHLQQEGAGIGSRGKRKTIKAVKRRRKGIKGAKRARNTQKDIFYYGKAGR